MSQSDTESMASSATLLRRDLDDVDRLLADLGTRRIALEKELRYIAGEEAVLRRRQRRLLNSVFSAKHGEEDAFPDGPEVPGESQVEAEATVLAKPLQTVALSSPAPGSLCRQTVSQFWRSACVSVVLCDSPTPFGHSHYSGTPVPKRKVAVVEEPFCKACRNVARVGNQNGVAHLRVWPCTWQRKNDKCKKGVS